MVSIRALRLCLIVVAFAAMTTATGFAGTLSVTYFEISSSDPSYNQLCCGGPYSTPEVLATLGPNGLPMLNPAYPGLKPAAADLYSTGEITWWSPALNGHVTLGGSGTVTLPIDVTSNFFPPDGTGSNDYSGGLAAKYTGNLYAPTTETISFSIGSDDSAFAYLDGQLVCDDGGVHGFSAGTCVTPFDIAQGYHSLTLFFDDLNQVQSGLYFGVNTEGVTVNTPEPASLVLLGSGLVGLAGVIRRKLIA